MVSEQRADERIRSFIAVELPNDVKKKVSGLQYAFRDAGVRASWVREESLHLTLRFLGDISQVERKQIEYGLAQTCAEIPPFEVNVSGCGAFPNSRSPRVLWAGLTGDLDRLMNLAVAAENAAREAGLEPDRKRFRAHVTMGRIRDRGRTERVERALDIHADFSGGVIAVGRVSLFASELRPSGAKHTVLRTFDLGKPE